MHQNPLVVPLDPPVEGRVKVWSTPVVSVLSIDDTANNATVGDDGNGTFTGS